MTNDECADSAQSVIRHSSSGSSSKMRRRPRRAHRLRHGQPHTISAAREKLFHLPRPVRPRSPTSVRDSKYPGADFPALAFFKRHARAEPLARLGQFHQRPPIGRRVVSRRLSNSRDKRLRLDQRHPRPHALRRRRAATRRHDGLGATAGLPSSAFRHAARTVHHEHHRPTVRAVDGSGRHMRESGAKCACPPLGGRFWDRLLSSGRQRTTR